jgi:hypothetical protein
MLSVNWTARSFGARSEGPKRGDKEGGKGHLGGIRAVSTTLSASCTKHGEDSGDGQAAMDRSVLRWSSYFDF